MSMIELFNDFLKALIVDNFLTFIVFIIIIWLLIYYFKNWPKIIVLKIMNSKNMLINLTNSNFQYSINGNRKENNTRIQANPLRKSKWFFIGGKVEVVIKHDINEKESILRSEVRFIDRVTFFEFKFTDEDLKIFLNQTKSKK